MGVPALRRPFGTVAAPKLAQVLHMATPTVRRDALHGLRGSSISSAMANALARLHGRCHAQKAERQTKRDASPHWADPAKDAWT